MNGDKTPLPQIEAAASRWMVMSEIESKPPEATTHQGEIASSNAYQQSQHSCRGRFIAAIILLLAGGILFFGIRSRVVAKGTLNGANARMAVLSVAITEPKSANPA